MIREVAILKLKADVIGDALRLLGEHAAFKRTRPGCRAAAVNPMAKAPAMPYLDANTIMLYAEYDDLQCLAQCSQAVQEHFELHALPFQDFLVGAPVYGVFEA